MGIFKKFAFVAAALALTGVAFAQDYEEYYEEEYYEEESFDPTLSIGGVAEVAMRTWVDLRNEDNERSDIENLKTEGIPSLKLNFDYEGTSSLFNAKLKFNKYSLQEGYYWDILDEFKATAVFNGWTVEAGKMRLVWGKTDKVHVLDNFNANDYTDYLIPDYNDRRIAEPMFHVIYATPFSSNLKFEAVYTPVMTPDRLGSGAWEPKAAKKLTGNVTSAAMAAYATAVTNAEQARQYAARVQALNDAGNTTELTKLVTEAAEAGKISYTPEEVVTYCVNNSLDPTDPTKQVLAAKAILASKFPGYVQENLTEAVTAQNLALTNLSALSSDSSFLYPDTYQLKYGQAGFRTTFTVGPFDLGASYYYGHLKQPSFNAKKFKAAMPNYLATGELGEGDKFLSYDKVQIFGLEGAFVTPIWLGALNTRFEAAYNMTEDMDGDDPFVHNNSINWVAGFDRDLPIHNVNLNVQTQGKYLLGGDKIDDMGPLKALDVDADPDDCYTNNKVIVDLTDTWYYENVKLDIKGIYGIERGDLVVMPSLAVRTAGGNLTITGSGLFMWCKDENSEFDGWQNNSFAQIGVKYNF